MGTRADFYIGTDPATMEYLGSVAWDGNYIDPVALKVRRYIRDLSNVPEGVSEDDAEWYFEATSEPCTVEDYRQRVRAFIESRDDGSLPDRDGWPWPWETSATTDCVYTWSDGKILAAKGDPERWLAHPPELNADTDEYIGFDSAPLANFPDMSGLQRTTYGRRSGLIIVEVARWPTTSFSI